MTSKPLFWPHLSGTQQQLAHLGLTRLPLIKEPSFKGSYPGDTLVLTDAQISTALLPMIWHDLYVLDIENWKLEPSLGELKVKENATKYEHVLEVAKARTPNSNLGLYGLPLRNWFSAVSGDPVRIAEKRKHNDLQQGIVDRSDALFPSCYVPVTLAERPTIDQWKKATEFNVTECNRLGKGKPVYPFLWDRTKDNKELTPEFMIEAVKFLWTIPCVSGIVFWVEADRPWNVGSMFKALRGI